ncbi:hypothetical protein [Vibrio quintilis]|uniref:Uncharacterized protein n=1 Tax=Vibrio quintilis TaxID=1117707 RepID=A0A1M7YNZ2_9VIBR|nr:hypothetical protein [Vibrio quintilis]SHO54331.1 hypothetical protein VQ7734_00045 [Vibrio quintilis]
MENMIYNLSLYGANEKKAMGALCFDIAAKDALPDVSNLADIWTRSSGNDEISFDVVPIEASFICTNILGNIKCLLNGCMFTSDSGPTLTTTLDGGQGQHDITIQFNFMDSPADNIGGILRVDDHQSWCFLGSREK